MPSSEPARVSDGCGASFQRPLIIRRNSLSVPLFPLPPPMHNRHMQTCRPRPHAHTPTHTSRMQMHTTPPSASGTHAKSTRGTQAVHAHGLHAHSTQALHAYASHTQHTHTQHTCTAAQTSDTTRVLTPYRARAHTYMCDRASQGCSHPVRGDKQGPGAVTNNPKGQTTPCSLHSRAPARFQPHGPCSGPQGCQPGTSRASHPHPRLWLVDRVINKK